MTKPVNSVVDMDIAKFFDISVAKGRSKSREIRVMVAIVSTKDDWTLSVLRYKWQYTGITEFLLSYGGARF